MDYKVIEDILSTYSLEAIFELNNLTEEDVLYILVEEGHIQLPNPKPVIL